MVQWVNCLRNNIFVNPPPLSLLCEISGALNLAQPGLTAGRQAGRQAGKLAGRQSDEIQVNFKIFKVGCRSKYVFDLSVRLTKVQHHYSLTNAVFQVKPVARLILKCNFSGSHMISYQSLLLSTIVLNDYIHSIMLHIHMDMKQFIKKAIIIAMASCSDALG